MSSPPNSSDFKRKYNHCKKRVKQWEEEFKTTNGRVPDKVDIRSANPKIREYYKMYWHLKSSLLESTILGPSTEDEPLLPEVEPLKVSENKIEIVRSTKETHQTTVDSKINDENVVNNATSNLKNRKTNSENALKPTKKNLSKNESNKWLKSASSKLFAGTSFNKRNPRKSLSKKSQLDSSVCSQNESFNQSLSQSFMSDASFQSCPSPLIDSQLDEASFIAENEISPKIKSLIESKTALSPMFSSVKKFTICTPPPSVTPQSFNLLTDVSKPPASKFVSSRKLDLGWVERCTQVVEKELEQGRVSMDSGFDSLGSLSSLTVDPSPAATPLASEEGALWSDDELICDSDDENSSQMLASLKRKSTVLEPVAQPEETTAEPAKRVKFDVPNTSIYNVAKAKQTAVLTPTNKAIETKKEILEKKIQAGTLNENYVKINMKKKVYVRGKKHFNLGNYKKKEWKKRRKNLDLHSGGESGGVLRCFKCGDIGHFARGCQAVKEDKLLPVDEGLEDDPGLPSLEEAEALAREVGMTLPVKKNASLLLPEPEPLPADLPDLEGIPQQARATTVPPLTVTREEVHSILQQFGHESFRPGQETAVMRVLAGKSTLLMLSTGGGKSLCYQLPAYLYHETSPSIALVVSPLVSLMDDQVAGSLSFCKIGCLHTNQTEKQKAKVIESLKAGELSALLVSPEAVVSCDNFGFGAVVKELPPIAFACIDEVHCVSQWSYNFRPSYLMLTKVLRERFGVKTFLGLTATASKTTVASIVKELGIDEADGVIQDTPLPSHLHLAVSREQQKDAALLDLIRSTDGGATLVYCTRRDECVRLATLIRTAVRGVTAQPYHAGLVASRRKTVQRSFMQGKLQVVVATVAFGMGINKQDIRCVFHYNMTKDWESYVQEVGRAGRDGQPARCHLLLDPKGTDLQELRRHIYSNAVERPALRRLLARVFTPCSCTPGACPGHEVAFSIPDAVQALDLPEENIATLLCYLELHPDRLIQVLTPAYMTCKIQSYHGARGIHKAARECPPLAVAAAQGEEGGKAASLTFDVVALARKIGWESGTVKRHLKQTEWKRDKAGSWRRSGMHVNFSDLGQRVRSRGDLTPEQLDEALDYLVGRVEEQQTTALNLLQSVYSTFHFFSSDMEDQEKNSRSDELKKAIRSYFATEKMPEDVPTLKIQDEDFNEEIVAADVRQLVCTYRDNTFNGRAVARIFHGMQSPNYPAPIWFRARQWRAHLDKPFAKLQLIATREILKLK